LSNLNPNSLPQDDGIDYSISPQHLCKTAFIKISLNVYIKVARTVVKPFYQTWRQINCLSTSSKMALCRYICCSAHFSTHHVSLLIPEQWRIRMTDYCKHYFFFTHSICNKIGLCPRWKRMLWWSLFLGKPDSCSHSPAQYC
jgi:uncharacterized membrane protein YbaN (DUF454 family)